MTSRLGMGKWLTFFYSVLCFAVGETSSPPPYRLKKQPKWMATPVLSLGLSSVCMVGSGFA
jgi:hypothetical protein